MLEDASVIVTNPAVSINKLFDTLEAVTRF